MRAVVCLIACLVAGSAYAQSGASLVDGSVSAMVDVLPDISPSPERQSASELRVRLFAERQQQVGEHLTLNAAGYVDGLLADRPDRVGTTHAAFVRPTELYAELRYARFDLRAGASRLAWGRLDEFQPSDVVNPLDLSRFFLEGRSEARLAVGMVRGRVFLPRGVTVEGVVVPRVVRGRFDQLGEPSSPFNLSPQIETCRAGPATGPCPAFATVRSRPGGWSGVQGGGRATGTIGRVDVGASIYRGIEPFPLYTLLPPAPGSPQPVPAGILETFPSFTMVSGDFEAVRGPWGMRGEVALFPQDTLQSTVPLRSVRGRSVEAGFGADRRAGSYRVSGNVIVSHRRATGSEPPTPSEVDATSALLVGWAERTFARETRSVRLLAAYNPELDSAFVRAVGAVSVRDNVWLELSGGWLRGTATDLLSRLAMRDFVYARVRVHF